MTSVFFVFIIIETFNKGVPLKCVLYSVFHESQIRVPFHIFCAILSKLYFAVEVKRTSRYQFRLRKHMTIIELWSYHANCNQLRDMRCIHKFQTADTADFVANTMVSSWQDYCNSPLYREGKGSVTTLQKVRNGYDFQKFLCYKLSNFFFQLSSIFTCNNLY